MKERQIVKTRRVITGLMHNVIGTVLPSIIGLILLSVISKPKEVHIFIDKGDLFLYSAALLSSSLFLFNENENKEWILKKNMMVDYYISISLIWFIIFSSVMYGGIFLSGQIIPVLNTAINIDLNLVRWVSVLLICFSIYCSYRALSVQFESKEDLPDVDLKQESDNEIDDLMVKLKEEDAATTPESESGKDTTGPENPEGK
ncbi:MAG: hypothetical protein NTZ10_01355 [Candidatus Saganbacteria bacterium]|nr:hypothetical protein [Candidatus Saganbacteria bacterium]